MELWMHEGGSHSSRDGGYLWCVNMDSEQDIYNYCCPEQPAVTGADISAFDCTNHWGNGPASWRQADSLGKTNGSPSQQWVSVPSTQGQVCVSFQDSSANFSIQGCEEWLIHSHGIPHNTASIPSGDNQLYANGGSWESSGPWVHLILSTIQVSAV